MRTKTDVLGMNILVIVLPGNGHLECLKYAHENGCPWNEDTCSNAAKNGHLECLKYLHENRCPWDNLLVLLLPKMVTSSV